MARSIEEAPASSPRLRVARDAIRFTAHDVNGFPGITTDITLRQLVEDGDPTPLLLWGLFYQIYQLNETLAQAEQKATDFTPEWVTDPAGFIEKMKPVVGFMKELMFQDGLGAHVVTQPEGAPAATPAATPQRRIKNGSVVEVGASDEE